MMSRPALAPFVRCVAIFAAFGSTVALTAPSAAQARTTSTSSASGTLYDASGAHLQPTGPVPEPASWALMIGGLGLAGAALRSRRQAAPVA